MTAMRRYIHEQRQNTKVTLQDLEHHASLLEGASTTAQLIERQRLALLCLLAWAADIQATSERIDVAAGEAQPSLGHLLQQQALKVEQCAGISSPRASFVAPLHVLLRPNGSLEAAFLTVADALDVQHSFPDSMAMPMTLNLATYRQRSKKEIEDHLDMLTELKKQISAVAERLWRELEHAH